jgi:hypothetical protein
MESHQKQQSNNSHKTAFILGNGTSRQEINAKSLLELGIVYGCNAQYREFNPHYLIAVDVKMINEIIDSGFYLSNTVWTNPNKGVKSNTNINFFDPHKGWSSGPTALWFAATNRHKKIYILGFDFQGLNGKFNNVYADTFNYKRSKDNATYYGNWLNQTERVVKEFKNIEFIRVIQPGNFIPEKLQKISNLTHITYDEFKKEYEHIDFS